MDRLQEKINGKNAPDQGFQSNVAELKDDIFIINPNQVDTAKFEKTIEAIIRYVVRNFDAGILLAKGIRKGKLPIVDLSISPIGIMRKKKRKTKKKKKKKKEKEKKKEKKSKRNRKRKRK